MTEILIEENSALIFRYTIIYFLIFIFNKLSLYFMQKKGKSGKVNYFKYNIILESIIK